MEMHMLKYIIPPIPISLTLKMCHIPHVLAFTLQEGLAHILRHPHICGYSYPLFKNIPYHVPHHTNYLSAGVYSLLGSRWFFADHKMKARNSQNVRQRTEKDVMLNTEIEEFSFIFFSVL